MRESLIIDGHNVIHRLKRYRRLQERTHKTAIEELIADLINLGGSEDVDITVVFDGRETTPVTEIGGIKVVYSGNNRSADSIIEKLVFEASGERSVTICTSDYAQQKVVWRKRTKRMTPRDLDEMMADTSEENRELNDGKTRFRLEGRVSKSTRKKLEDMRLGRT